MPFGKVYSEWNIAKKGGQDLFVGFYSVNLLLKSRYSIELEFVDDNRIWHNDALYSFYEHCFLRSFRITRSEEHTSELQSQR